MERLEGDPKGSRRGQKQEQDNIVAEGEWTQGNTEQDGGHPHPKPGIPTRQGHQLGGETQPAPAEELAGRTAFLQPAKGKRSQGPAPVFPGRAKKDRRGTDRR